MNVTNAKSLQEEKGKKAALIFLDYIIGFAKSVDEQRPDLGFVYPLMQLEELNTRLKNSTPPLKSEYEVDVYLHEIINKILHIDPQLHSQLKEFWEAQMEITTRSNEGTKDYHPQKIAEENYQQIMKIDDMYRYVKMKFKENENEKMFIFALFYIHILKTEVIEHSFRVQFEKVLQDFNLNSKYDSKRIFSVKNKILKQKEKKGNLIDDWVTDARAIRDALAHNHYELIFEKNSWKIHFKNHEKGYNFEATFSKDEFQRFLTNTDVLYRSTMMIIFRVIAGTLIKLFYVQQN